MRQIARTHGYRHLVASIRPAIKRFYPLIPIEDYMGWKNSDGHPFDPWLRVHHKAGGQMLHVCHRVMSVKSRLEQWADWTGMAFPDEGQFVVPHGLVPVSVLCDEGDFAEPGIWILHRLEYDREVS